MSIKFYRLILTLLTLYSSIAVSQENERKILKGIVENEITKNTMNGVHVLNLSTIVGTTSDEKGVFEIEAKAKDTLYFSYLGFKPFKVAVTADMLKFENPKFKLTLD